MQLQMKMPDLTTNESSIRIVRWIVRPGDTVKRGQPLLEAETDKATMEVESAVSGVLNAVLCQVDEEVCVGQPIAVFDLDEMTSGLIPARGDQSPETVLPVVAAPPVALQASGGSPTQPAGNRVGMFARNRAASTAATAQLASLPLSVAQRTAARRLQESKQTVPHFYLQTSFNASAIVARRKAAEPLKLAWDAFFVRAVAEAIGRFDRFRYRFDGERLVRADGDAVGVAIDVDDELFVIPVCSPADKTVEQISEEIRRGRERLRSGDQEVRRIHSALMTVTNLGVCNVESFIPIINPPEASILGVGKVMLSPAAQDDGSILVQHRCTITLSVDHRVASGKYAAGFLGAIVDELENMA
jgi:pyruvate dehydrogenase E2 component (dihydrolipoamide acetyltransferase)